MNEIARPGESEVVPAPMPGAQPIVLRPDEAVPAPVPAAGGWGWLSPLNRRRLDNFRRNRLGYGSFLIFSALFVLSLFAEFIANDRPIVLSYKGEWLVPVLVDYPEEKFGGFLAVTDFRSPEIRKEIAEHGWALWPPIRFSYDTINEDLPTPSPSPPTWMLSDAQCKPVAEKLGGATCADIPWHWLGTDNTTRDVLARVIYGFRISVLFGLILATVSSAIGVVAGAVQGYFGGWVDLAFQRFIGLHRARLLRPARDHAAVLVGGAGQRRTRRVPAGPELRIRPGRARAGPVEPAHHDGSPAAERHGGDPDLPAVHPERLDHDADLPGLPGLRPAAWLALARGAARPGQGQPDRPVARADRIPGHRRDAKPAGLRRRSSARRVRSA
jgi:hypothetical protein